MEEQKEKLDFKGFVMILCLVILIISRFIQVNDQLNTYLVLITTFLILIVTIIDDLKESHLNPLKITQPIGAILSVIMIISLVFYIVSGQFLFAILMISAGIAETIIDICRMKNGEFSKGIHSILNLILLGIIMLNYITLR
jgi:CDP-diglyceride synthetase